MSEKYLNSPGASLKIHKLLLFAVTLSFHGPLMVYFQFVLKLLKYRMVDRHTEQKLCHIVILTTHCSFVKVYIIFHNVT